MMMTPRGAAAYSRSHVRPTAASPVGGIVLGYVRRQRVGALHAAQPQLQPTVSVATRPPSSPLTGDLPHWPRPQRPAQSARLQMSLF